MGNFKIDLNLTENGDPIIPSSLFLDVEGCQTTNDERDIERIQVCITDPTPIVMLFGAKATGKTMALIRLSRYLHDCGYIVEPDRTFFPSSNYTYQLICNNFDRMVYGECAAEATHTGLLVNVKNNRTGKPICQILDANGLNYFDEYSPNKDFPLYIQMIIENNNPKIWIFFLEKDWQSMSVREAYANKINMLCNNISFKDKIILLCSKADRHSQYLIKGKPDKDCFFNDLQNPYSGLFYRLKNRNPVTRLYRKYNFDFVVFSAGHFSTGQYGENHYVPSRDNYPAKLWKSILKTL